MSIIQDSVLTGYCVTERLHIDDRTIVYRGLREQDQRPVILKLLRREYPTPRELSQFRNQYDLARSLHLPGVIETYDLIIHDQEHRYVLVMEDFGGITLTQALQQWGLDRLGETVKTLQDFLTIALQIVKALDGIHRHKIIHKDLKPSNILIHPDTQEVKIIDFSSASGLSREIQDAVNLADLKGTLEYISPEQTGRINRYIDHRTDYYSLGITFFQLLTGSVPFNDDNPIHLLHSHLAQSPPLIHTLNPNVPPIVSEIIAKLMAKMPENRYQSMIGLSYDLQNCLAQLNTSDHIQDFPLGQGDRSDRFIISDTLYGREADISKLLESFEKIAIGGRSELLLVTGDSGLGKTALIHEIHKPVALTCGYFVRGKFEQFQQNIPFSGIVQALQALIIQLLSESLVQITQWKELILNALGDSAQIIIDLIPQLEGILGAQPPVPSLSGISTQNRFHLLFQKFIQVFATPEYPLVIFLDDLQWADTASLNLIRVLLSNEQSRSLLVITTYRDREVTIAHPLMTLLANLQLECPNIVTEIHLLPLSSADLRCMVNDTLHLDPVETNALADRIYQVTQGNPFFSSQLLKSFYSEGLITFDWTLGKWIIDLVGIQARSLTPDVVEFMGAQVSKLPIETQDVLKLAAYIGSQFDLETLAIALSSDEASSYEFLIQFLHPAIEEGLIFANSDVLEGTLDCANNSYQFLHDRVQQAAYQLIPESQRAVVHFNIGQQLLTHISPPRLDDRLFEIVGQLNYGIGRSDLADSIELSHQLLLLNQRAGAKAMDATAYESAIQYWSHAIRLLSNYPWQDQYDLALDLHNAATTAAALKGDFEQMERWSATVLREAQSPIDRVTVYEVKIQSYTSQNRLVDSIAIARESLALFGVSFPTPPIPQDIQQALQNTETLLEDCAIDDLANLPLMTNPIQLSVMQLISSVVPAAFLSEPALFPLLISSQVESSIQYGNSPLSSFNYANYGVLLNAFLQDPIAATRFGDLGLKLAEKEPSKDIKSRVLFVFAAFILHSQSHLKETLPILLESYQYALEVGNWEYVGYCLQHTCFNSYFLGHELNNLEQEIQTSFQTLTNLHQTTSLQYVQIFWQVVLNLKGQSKIPHILIGSVYDEETILPSLIAAHDITGLHLLYTNKLIISYLFGEFSLALDCGSRGRSYLAGGTGYVDSVVFNFYDSLTLLAVYHDRPQLQDQLLQDVVENQLRLKHSANHAPMNHLHKFYLVEAERYRVLGQRGEAIEYYDLAISGAKTSGYLNEEALAYELAARFYLEWEKPKIAQSYLIDAYYRYERWGAIAKMQHLERLYPQLLMPILHQEMLNSHDGGSFGHTTNTSNLHLNLDLATVMEASQLLSGEIQMDSLLESLMDVVITSAGAEKAVLILAEEEHWQVVAETLARHQTVVRSIPLSECNALPKVIVNYVIHTSETLVLEDATQETSFINDPYLGAHKPRSILCAPIQYQGKMIGILYLENNLVTGSFTSDRLKILNIITTQAAISLQNAQLYDRLEQKVEERTLQIQQTNQSLMDTLSALKQTQTQLIQTEKMSSLGQMVAGFAHEINNPVNFIHGNLKHADHYFQDLLGLLSCYQKYYPQPIPEIISYLEGVDIDYVLEDLPKLFASMQMGTERIREIVLSLRNFSRLDESVNKAVNVHEGIESTLLLLNHRLKSGIKVVRQYQKLPPIHCYPAPLNQVFMNLLSNAIDALNDYDKSCGKSSEFGADWVPTIDIVTKLLDSSVIIQILDNGAGIPEEIIKKVFDPFFTTKPVGSGTGLGLSISYQIIVDKHKGKISCQSKPGKGAEFTIELPISMI